jgi:Ca-activated chloride channel family protein
VVVISDGRNEDRQGIDLDTLLRGLKAQYNTDRPVHVITIAYGADADPATLNRIAKSTDGINFTSPDPRDIGQVFLTAISAITA